MTQMISGAPNPPQRSICREGYKSIPMLVAGYQNNHIIEFLKRIS